MVGATSSEGFLVHGPTGSQFLVVVGNVAGASETSVINVMSTAHVFNQTQIIV